MTQLITANIGARADASPKKPSLISIDIMRAIAALGVFGYHQHVFYLIARYIRIPWLASLDNFGANYAVPLFFLLSGYCIHLSNIKYVKSSSRLPLREYYTRRLLRIYPPYFVALVISLIVQARVTNTHYTIPDITAHVFLLQGFSATYFNSINLVLWTISIEFAFYMLYPIFYYLRINYSLNKALVFAGCVSAISIAWFSFRANVTLPQTYFVGNIWFAWCCGAYLADLNSLNSKSLERYGYKIAYAVVAVLFAISCCYHWPWSNIIEYQLKILIWSMPLLLMIRIEKWFNKPNAIGLKLMVAIGLSSYSLYLLHEPLIALKNYAVHAILPQNLQAAGVASGILFIPAICWLNYLYAEKPFMVRKVKLNG